MGRVVKCAKHLPPNRAVVLAWDNYDETWRVMLFQMYDANRHDWEDYFVGETFNDHRITHWTDLPPDQATASENRSSVK